MTSTSRDRLDDLLCLEVTSGLTPAETAELNALLAALPDEDRDATACAAAAVHLAVSGPPEPMPAALAEKLHLAAVAFTPSPPSPRLPKVRPAWMSWAGWAVAAVLAWLLLYTNWPKPPEVKREPTFAEAREKLLKDNAAKAGTFEEAKPDISATVVWSTAKQDGYLEVRGLKPNDPTKEQYQLWIVDPAQKNPVDGGVFDVNPDGTALVRVRAPIRVTAAQAFAVTKEKAGGVVVSAGPMLLVLTPKAG